MKVSVKGDEQAENAVTRTPASAVIKLFSFVQLCLSNHAWLMPTRTEIKYFARPLQFAVSLLVGMGDTVASSKTSSNTRGQTLCGTNYTSKLIFGTYYY